MICPQSEKAVCGNLHACQKITPWLSVFEDKSNNGTVLTRTTVMCLSVAFVPFNQGKQNP